MKEIFKNNKKGAIIALVFGSITWILVAALLNAVYAIPAYSVQFGIDTVLKMLTVIPGVTEENYISKYILFGCIPFNLMLSVVVSLVTYLVYKKISWLFEKMDNKISKKKEE